MAGRYPWSALSPHLQASIEREGGLTPMHAGASDVRGCGCQTDLGNRWILCRYHQGFQDAEAIVSDTGSSADQIAKLADFIIHNVHGEPSRSEGAVDTAIRILTEDRGYLMAGLVTAETFAPGQMATWITRVRIWLGLHGVRPAEGEPMVEPEPAPMPRSGGEAIAMSDKMDDGEIEAFLEAINYEPLTFGFMKAQNGDRAERWHEGDFRLSAWDGSPAWWTGADWSNAMTGEAGEAANVVKKLRRIETAIVGTDPAEREDLLNQLGWELADVILYADLLASYYGIDLERAVREKFNHVSEREGFPERL